MDKNLNETGLINQATTERLYGVQNAPPTWSGIRTPYDEIATRYDDQHPTGGTALVLRSSTVYSIVSGSPPRARRAR